MKSKRTQIIEAIVAALSKIKKGVRVPGMSTASDLVYSSSPALVTRALRDPSTVRFPAIFVTDPMVEFQHMLSDVRKNTMRVMVSGVVQMGPTGVLDGGAAINELDVLMDDVETALSVDTTWGGLANHSVLRSLDASTEVEEDIGAVSIWYEVRFFDRVRVPAGKANLTPLPVDQAGEPLLVTITNSLYNMFLDIPEIACVELADEWPMPLEAVPSWKVPGVWFRAQQETFQYHASRLSTKTLLVSAMAVAVDENRETFRETIDRTAANVKNVIGKYADLEGRVLTLDLQTVRVGRSDYPVAIVDTDFTVRYMQSFEES